MRPSILHAAFVGALLVGAPSASAQQHQAQQPQTHQTTQGSQQHAQAARPALVHFPMSAGAYQMRINRVIGILRKTRLVGPLTQGDIDRAILITKDCAMRAEADGVVTKEESKGCQKRLAAFRKQRVHEIMTSSSPSDWARWKSMVPQDTDKD